ncbi:uncharacterized protein LOC142226615 [Haematobia irritans]|uniref:uncharacterized protein LOC142226615 n=1 Tax=Haematobia irritans TaxID=7368 RepID=UPI003F501CD5
MKAYGAAVYVRAMDDIGRLAASKSRVASLKIVTLPRLELCASMLLVDLMETVVEGLKDPIETSSITFHTDSSIVLSWLKLEPATLQIFVSNRVSSIQSRTEIFQWRHVRSHENPADLLSRGLLRKELIGNKLWFEGPAFLQKLEIPESFGDPVPTFEF